jgi:hypothetical protein
MSLLNLFPMTCHPNMRISNSLPSMKNMSKNNNKPVNKLVNNSSNHCNNNQNISVMLICKENYIHHTIKKKGLKKIFNEKKGDKSMIHRCISEEQKT